MRTGPHKGRRYPKPDHFPMTLRKNTLPLALVLASLPGLTQAAISYATLGSLYQENFDSLPTDAPSGGNLQTSAYTTGWVDDSSTVAGTSIGIPGVYLYHPSFLAEGGSNGHQRLRIGPGANTGSFWGFSAPSTAMDKALGDVGSTTVAGEGAPVFIAIRLVNSTGLALNSFTLTYDGEQWRDGQSASPETLSFGYSTVATAGDWFAGAVFTQVAALSFTSPVFNGTSSGGTPVIGNAEGLTSDITSTITGLDWQPDTDLWLRWEDTQLAGNADDGLAIDNVRFSAVPEPSSLLLLLAGAGIAAARRRRPSVA